MAIRLMFYVDKFAGSYGTTIAPGVPWQAAPLRAIGNADTTHQLEVSHQLRLAHVAQQGNL